MNFSLEKIEAILRDEDIEMLLQLGAPRDEYSIEARKIAAALEKLPDDQLNETNITATVAFVWKKMFGIPGRPDHRMRVYVPKFKRVAQRLMEEPTPPIPFSPRPRDPDPAA